MYIILESFRTNLGLKTSREMGKNKISLENIFRRVYVLLGTEHSSPLLHGGVLFQGWCLMLPKRFRRILLLGFAVSFII